MDYKQKYLKYKKKYKNLKILDGGVFNIIRYLGSGAENIAFELDNKRVLRIRKDCVDLNNRKQITERDTEINILNLIKQNNPKYFVKIHEIGDCIDLKKKFDVSVNKVQIKIICSDNIKGDTCRYNYVIMDNAPGQNIIEYIVDKLLSFEIQDTIDFTTDINKLNCYINIYYASSP